ncbi:MAG: thioredoxin [Bacillota bacterium]|nr:thioredoxin [Bacillota bacterium]
MSALVQNVTDQTFKSDVLDSQVPVLVDFWAAWCGPCRMMAPVLDQAAKDLEGKIKIAKLNTDENPETASKYGIMSIPTMILFKDGKPAGKIVGYVPKAQLTKTLESAIA